MARTVTSTDPVKTLSDSVQLLEAAVLVCLATPKKKPVHRLRTWTRRIEAQLELIALLQPELRATKTRKKALRLLQNLRRAAGAVRDIDVQRGLIAQEMSRVEEDTEAAAGVRKNARGLRRHLKRQREAEADKLIALLKKKLRKLPIVLRDLCAALGSFEKISLPGRKLAELVGNWHAQYARTSDETKILHAIRKRAKLARYMLETLATTAKQSDWRGRRLAAHFEAVQHTGGRWHDLLQLSEMAAKELGRASPLTKRVSAKAGRALHAYQRRLAAGPRRIIVRLENSPGARL